MASHLQHVFPKALDEILNRNFAADEQVYIDCLQLQIETPPACTEQQLQALIMQELVAAIEKKKREIRVEKTSNGLPGIADGAAVSDVLLPFKAWVWFLQHGSLPWWYSPSPVKDWEFILESLIKEQNSTTSQFFADIMQQPAVRLRWVLQTSDAFKRKTLISLFSKTEMDFEAIKTQIKITFESFFLPGKMVAGNIFEQGMPEVAAWLLMAEATFGHTTISEKLIMQKWLSVTANKGEEIVSLQKAVIDLQQLIIRQDIMQNDSRPLENFREEDREHDLVNSEKIKTELIGSNEALVVYNAGIVLLHPYLVHLFSALQLLDDTKQIKDPCKAIGLLAILCGDDADTAEYNLPVLKLLCGVADVGFVYAPHNFTLNEKEECTALLLAVIEHWPALRSTSPAGLQETFLKRMGKLCLKDDHYELQVESHGTDVLLGSLPWGFSMIKLPWMKMYLTVEWNQG